MPQIYVCPSAMYVTYLVYLPYPIKLLQTPILQTSACTVKATSHRPQVHIAGGAVPC